LIVAVLPDRAELERPFAFMQKYMSVTRNASAPHTPPT
jgi:hypothetical protein